MGIQYLFQGVGGDGFPDVLEGGRHVALQGGNGKAT